MTTLIAEGDLTGAAVVLGVLTVVLVVGEAWARIGDPDPERSRKFVHLFSGGVCLLFPFFVTSPVVVGALAIGMSALFATASRYQLLKSLHRVERAKDSRGSEYYPVAIFLVFLLAADDLWIYFSAVLTLGVADAFAALIGTRYGRLKYTVQDGQKSVEGSLAFFAITAGAILISAPFFAELPWPNLLQIAFTTAVVLTAFEAISLRGADNLFVPVAAAVILAKLAADPYTVLLFQNLHLLAFACGAIAVNLLAGYTTGTRDTRPFDTGGILTFTLFAFATWALGSASWALPVIVGYLLAIIAWITSGLATGVHVKIPIRVAYRALLIPFAILIFANISGHYALLFGPYLASCAAVLAFTITTFWRPSPKIRGPLYSTRFSIAVGFVAALCVTIPPFLFYPDVGLLGGPGLLVALTTVICAVNYRIVERRLRDADDHFWPASHFTLPILAALIVLGLQHLGLIGHWTPPPDAELMRYSWEPFWW